MNKKQKAFHSNRTNRYCPPVIKHRGALRQFSGSPLSKSLQNPLDMPGQ